MCQVKIVSKTTRFKLVIGSGCFHTNRPLTIRNFNPTDGGSFAQSVDPRSFYAEGFVAPWPDLNIR